MKLYDYFRSSAAYRVRIALNFKGLTPDDRAFVHLRMGNQRAQDYLARNPQGLVPALEVDDDRVLTQSLAIIEYLNEIQPEPALLPDTPEARARVRAIALSIACEIHPLNNLRVLNYLTGTLGTTDEQKNGWYRYWIDVGFEALERQLARDRETGTYCHGDAPTIADICLVSQVFGAKFFNVETAGLPTAMRIFGECMKIDAFDRSQPLKQPDAPKNPAH